MRSVRDVASAARRAEGSARAIARRKPIRAYRHIISTSVHRALCVPLQYMQFVKIKIASSR